MSHRYWCKPLFLALFLLLGILLVADPVAAERDPEIQDPCSLTNMTYEPVDCTFVQWIENNATHHSVTVQGGSPLSWELPLPAQSASGMGFDVDYYEMDCAVLILGLEPYATPVYYDCDAEFQSFDGGTAIDVHAGVYNEGDSVAELSFLTRPVSQPVELRFAFLINDEWDDHWACQPPVIVLGLEECLPGINLARHVLTVVVTPDPDAEPPEPMTEAGVRVLSSPIEADPGTTFSVQTEWRIPAHPGYSIPDQQLVGYWNRFDTDRLEHIETQVGGQSVSSTQWSLSPGIHTLVHTYRVKSDARPGLVNITFRLADHIVHQTVQDSVAVQVGGEEASCQIMGHAVPVALPGQIVSMYAQCLIPNWVDDPIIRTSGYPHLVFDQVCHTNRCWTDNEISAPHGEVHIQAHYRVSDSVQNLTQREAARIELILNDDDEQLVALTDSFHVGSEPRIELGGDAYPCQDGYCVLFQRTFTGELFEKTVTINNFGSEGLTYSVGSAPYPFDQSDRPGGFLGAVASAPGYYENQSSFRVRFSAPEDDDLTLYCSEQEDSVMYLCSATITIMNNTPGRESVPLYLEGHADPPEQFAVHGDYDLDDTVDFGVVAVGQSATRELRIVNTGGQYLQGYLPVPFGENPAGFHFEPQERPFRISSQLEHVIHLTAAPEQDGEFEETFTVSASEGDEFLEREFRLRVVTGPRLQLYDQDPSNFEAMGSELTDGETVSLGRISVTKTSHPDPDDPQRWVQGAPVIRRIYIQNTTPTEADLQLDVELLPQSGSEGEWVLLDDSDQSVHSLPSMTLAQDEVLTVRVQASPKDIGPTSRTLAIRSDAVNVPSFATVRFEALALRPAGVAEIEVQAPSPTDNSLTINLGQIAVAQGKGAEIRVQNIGDSESLLDVDAELSLSLCDADYVATSPEASTPSGPLPEPELMSPPEGIEGMDLQPVGTGPPLSLGCVPLEEPDISLSTFSEEELPLALRGKTGEIFILGIRPTRPGRLLGSLTLFTNDPERAEETISISGEVVPYPVPELVDFGEMTHWFAATDAVAQGYHELDHALAYYLGTPIASSWPTYQKHFSRHNAGELIHLRAYIRASVLLVYLVADEMGQVAVVPEGYTLSQYVIGELDDDSRVIQLLEEMEQIETQAGVIGTAIRDIVDEQISSQLSPGGTVYGSSLGGQAVGFYNQWHELGPRLLALGDTVTEVEVTAYRRMGTAIRAFIEAANSAPNGVPQQLLIGNDPNGLLAAGLILYADAKRAGLEAAEVVGTPDAQVLLDERLAAISRGTQLLALYHHQILQSELYDHWGRAFSNAVPYVYYGPHGPTVFTGNWGEFYTRLGIDSTVAPANPLAITAATAPPFARPGDPAAAGTVGAYMFEYAIDGHIRENPAIVPLPGAVYNMRSYGSPLSVIDILTYVNEGVHILGYFASVRHWLNDGFLPVNVTTVGHIGGVVSGVCSAIALGAHAAHADETALWAEVCATIGAGVGIAFGDPWAYGSAALMFMMATIEVGQGLYDMHQLMPCWPDCTNTLPPNLEQYLYGDASAFVFP